MLEQNDKIIIKFKNEVFKDSYHSRVIKAEEDEILIEIPFSAGQPVLPAEGSMLYIFNKRTEEDHISELLEKKLSPELCFTIKKPFYKKGSKTRFISVASGKGGVGKTSFSINLAISLSRKGYNTFLLDADMGMANIDILMNVQARKTIKDLIDNNLNIMDIVVSGPGGVNIIPGGSGFQDLANIDVWKFNKLLNSFNELEKYADYVIIDTGAGIAKNVINFLLASHEVLVITTPEPHSITDAYALIKTIDETDPTILVKLIINKVENPQEANYISSRIINVAKENLKIKILKYGYILEDIEVGRAIKKRRPFLLASSGCPAARCVDNICDLIINKPYKDTVIRKKFTDRFKELVKL